MLPIAGTITLASKLIPAPPETFLSLWPHRFDFIFASHPEPGEKPHWKTETKYPLRDRVIEQGSALYGVRFGKTTEYCMVDIDRDSPYHPQNDPLAIHRIHSALESLGLVESVICQSSYSGGIHIYFPFTEAQASWEMGLVVTTLLQHQGFIVKGGTLEVFPNPRMHALDCTPSLYYGHRLPLQAGSYLLDKDFQPIPGEHFKFVQCWQCAKQKNDINEKTVVQVLKKSRRLQYPIKKGAQEFLNDLNAEIEPGWSDSGQTNRLLGRIALRSYIFGHVLSHKVPLIGDALIADIIQVARSLPGFEEHSGHVRDIEERAKDWAKSVEQSPRYYPYGTSNDTKKERGEPSRYNEIKQESARERIASALGELLNAGTLPSNPTPRAKALIGQFKFSAATLYKHKDLWHPNHLLESAPPSKDNAQNEVEPESRERGSAGGAPLSEISKHLLGETVCNLLPVMDYSDPKSFEKSPVVCNPLPIKGTSLTPLADILGLAQNPSPPPPELSRLITVRLDSIRKGKRIARPFLSDMPMEQRSLFEAQCIHDAYLHSGLASLIEEARVFFHENQQSLALLPSPFPRTPITLTLSSLSFSPLPLENSGMECPG
jgi:hypothetical protein